jgi:DNA-binding NarL/FixJ family response regulator
VALLEADRRGLAIDRLEGAMDDAHHCGAEPLVQRALDALRGCGKRPRRPAIRGLDALTPQQLRVARLAASGKTNPEIAEALFLTKRTVELHLTGSYRKLGISSREDLAAALDGAPFNASAS